MLPVKTVFTGSPTLPNIPEYEREGDGGGSTGKEGRVVKCF